MAIILENMPLRKAHRHPSSSGRGTQLPTGATVYLVGFLGLLRREHKLKSISIKKKKKEEDRMKCDGLGEASAQACFELAKKLVYHVPRLIWKKPGLTQGRSWSWGSEVGPQPSFQLLQQAALRH